MKFLFPHLGLGDAILLAGLAVELAKEHGGVVFPCYPHNEASVRSFFVAHPQIEVVPVKHETDMMRAGLKSAAPILPLGHYSHAHPESDETFDAWMHRSAGVPLEARWGGPIPAAAKRVGQFQIPLRDNYIFLHEDRARSFRIKPEFLPKMEHFVPSACNVSSILAYADALYHAKEVHVINSAFLHLAETLPTTGKLFLHTYARSKFEQGTFDIPHLRKPWILLD